jgi:hypothetical protein
LTRRFHIPRDAAVSFFRSASVMFGRGTAHQGGLLDNAIASLRSITVTSWIVAAVVSFTIYWICVYLYNVTLHPLAKFPGPKLAGATYWYEFYYDIYPNYARFIWKIKELHEEYG